MRVLLSLALVLAACGGAPPPPPPPPPKPVAPPPIQVMKPEGYVEVRVLDVISMGEGDTLLLVDDVSNVVLPMGIGGTEGSSIAQRVAGSPRRRPLTHDLMDDAVKRMGGAIVKVQIDELRDGTFHGSVYIRTKDQRLVRLDSRASDAVALGIGNGIPIYVNRKVLEEAGLDRDKVLPRSATDGPVT